MKTLVAACIDQLVHKFETRSYAELVEHLEQQIARCSIWMVEGN